jgi:Domain of unknown function (DUF397)
VAKLKGVALSPLVTSSHPGAYWRKSARCASNGGCVEIAGLPAGRVAARDSEYGAASPVLTFSTAAWREFVGGVKAGQFDPAR